MDLLAIFVKLILIFLKGVSVQKFARVENSVEIIRLVIFVKFAKVEKLIKLAILVKLVKFVCCHLMKVSLMLIKRRLM